MRWSSTEMTGTRMGRGAGSGSRTPSVTVGRRSWAAGAAGAEGPQLVGDLGRGLVDLVADEGVEVGQHQMEQVRASRRASPGRTAPRAWAAATASSKMPTKGSRTPRQLVGMGLGQPQVLADEGGGVGQAALDGEEPEQARPPRRRSALDGARPRSPTIAARASAPRRASSSKSATSSSSLPAKHR